MARAADGQDPDVGRKARLGPFRIERLLGAGGMAEVWAARHEADGTPVAVKILTRRGTGEMFLAAFAHEVQAAASLDHPAITAVYDHGVVTARAWADSGGDLPQGNPWLAMELVGGGTASRLRDGVTWDNLRPLLEGTLAGLAHAHARGVVHRDIKPGNLLLDLDRRVKLTDFGLAHALDGDGAGPTDADFVGTPRYMAPEQIECRWRDFGPWTDLYALGATAWALIAGQPPWSGSLEDVLAGHLAGRLPRLRPLQDMPDGLEPWLRRMLARRPEDRFRTAADAARALERLGGAPSPPGLPERWSRRPPRDRNLLGVGLGLYGQRAVGLVGREAERTALWQALRDVETSGRARLLLLEGPAGCGKTALARWLGEQAEELGAARLVRASHGEPASPADGLGALVLRLLRGHGLDRRALVERAGRLVDGEEEARAVAELAVPSADDDPTGLGVRFSGPAERHAVLRRLLERLADDRPLVLLVDDLPLSADAIGFLAHVLLHRSLRPAPLLVLATARSETLAARPDRAGRIDELLELDGTARLELDLLGREERAALVRELLGLDPSLAAQVEERSGGNPLFAVQLVADWVQRRLLVAGPAGFRLAEGAAPGLPTSLLEVWAARLEALVGDEGSTGRALELAAVLGVEVERDEWVAACARAGLPLPEAAVEELLRLRLATPGGAPRSWAFVHGMLREALLLRAERGGRLARWHGLCADLMADRPEAVVRRARHLLAAGRRGEAVAPLAGAVIDLLLAGEFGLAQELHELRERALTELAVPPEDPRRAWSALLSARLLRRTGAIEEARRRGLLAVRLASGTGDAGLLAEALAAAGTACVAAGALDEGLALLEEGRDVVALGGDARLRAAFANNLSFTSLRAGRLHQAKARAREAVLAAEEAGDLFRVAQGYGLLARVALREDRLDEAAWLIREARLRYERLGARWGLATATNTLGEVLRLQGDLEGAAAAFGESARRYDACGSGDAVFPTMNLGDTLARAGRHRRSLDLLVEVEAGLGEAGRRGLLAACRTILLMPLAALDRWMAYDATLAGALQGLEATGLVDIDVARSAERAAEVCEQAGQPARAARARGLADDQWRRLGREDRS